MKRKYVRILWIIICVGMLGVTVLFSLLPGLNYLNQ